MTLLHLAAYRGEPREIHSLLDAGAAVDTGDWTPLDFAAAAGRTANIEALLRRGAEVNERWRLWHWTPLFWAVSRGHAETVKALLAAGADVRAIDSTLRTPLHHAATRGQVTVIQPLLAAGAPLTAGDAQGRLPLHYAAAIHRADILGALLKAGGEVSARGLDGQTPLHALFARGWSTAAGSLATGPDMPRRMDKPEPSFAGATAALQLLLDAGADVNARDDCYAIKKGGKTGRTPLDWAQESLTEVSAEDRKPLADCVDLLLRHGAKTAEALDAEQHESPPPRDEPAR